MSHLNHHPANLPAIMRVLMAMCLLMGAQQLQAAVSVAQIFADHMVMQRDVVVPVWGWADAGETITVAMDGYEQQAVVGSDGRWMVRLAPMSTGAPRTMTITTKHDTLRIVDILLGEVWICGGQSNMSWPVWKSTHGEKETADAAYPEIRLFEVAGTKSPLEIQDRMDPKKTAEVMLDTPLDYCVWRPCDATSVKAFSATGYYFGRALYQHFKVPVGLIHTAVGGTPVESWMSRAALTSNPELKPAVEWWDKADAFAETPEGKQQLQLVANESVKKFGRVGWRADGWKAPLDRIGHPATFFNSRIHPLIPFAIKGVIWYQGEGNTGNAFEYRAFFPALIQDWRAQWGQGDFPFLFVQLANWGGAPPEKPMPSEWAELRESQSKTLKVPHTGMAVAIDIGEPAAMHPENKQDVGARLALAARAVAYGEKIVSSGPVFREMVSEGNALRISFDSVGGGLMAKAGTLKGFAIAGEDQVFAWATATIQGNSIMVTSEQVKKPIAVRYGWYHNPDCNLINREGLPASPFRTDTWPGVTDKKGYQARNAVPISFPIPKK